MSERRESQHLSLGILSPGGLQYAPWLDKNSQVEFWQA
jgi:hypothetical protein